MLPSPPEIDRAHRSLAAKPALTPLPDERSSFVEEDYSPEVLSQRAKYREVTSELYN